MPAKEDRINNDGIERKDKHMKQGWIQVDNNGTTEPLAPKTMADMVYVDGTQSKTVKDALDEGFVAVFAHTMNVVNGERVHNFEGPSGFMGMGRVLITEVIAPNDVLTVNGVLTYVSEDPVDSLPVGRWVTFVYDGTEIIVVGGGGGVGKWRVRAEAVLPVVVTDRTIVAITSVPTAGHVISDAQPANPTQGLVFVQVAYRSRTPIALNGHATVIPLSVQIYTSGAWTRIPAYFSLLDRWEPIENMLYYYGDQAVAFTGGWGKSGNNPQDSEFRTGDMRISLQNSTRATVVYTLNKLPVTNVSTVRLIGTTDVASPSVHWALAVAPSVGALLYADHAANLTTFSAYSERTQNSAGPFSMETSVSGLSGDYHVIVYARYTSGASPIGVSRVYEIELL